LSLGNGSCLALKAGSSEKLTTAAIPGCVGGTASSAPLGINDDDDDDDEEDAAIACGINNNNDDDGGGGGVSEALNKGARCG